MYKSPWGSIPRLRVLRRFGVCGCTPVRAFRCQIKEKVLHSSHFLALQRLSTKSVTPWLPTFRPAQVVE